MSWCSAWGGWTELGEVDRAAAQVTVGAGVTLARLQAHADAAGLAFGVDLAPRDSCTVGGMIATNAGGIHVVRYGTMRAQVAGIEAVLGDGSVISHLAGLAKDNTGYDLAGLLTGSEGTLAVITAARLRLVPRLEHRVTAGLGLAGVAEAVDAVALLRQRLAGLEAVELMLADGVRLVADQLGIQPPAALRAPAALIVEVGGHDDPVEELAAAVAELDLVGEPVVAVTPDQRRRLWEVRESFADAINRLGPPVKLDVSVPPARHGGLRGLAARRRTRGARGRRVRPPGRRQPPRQRHRGLARRRHPGDDRRARGADRGGGRRREHLGRARHRDRQGRAISTCAGHRRRSLPSVRSRRPSTLTASSTRTRSWPLKPPDRP